MPCWWSAALAADASGAWGPDPWHIVLLLVGAIVMRGAGCTWNDITDREFDAAVARTKSRPLPSGAVTLKQALLWMAVQAALGGLILLTYNGLSIALGIGSLVLVAVYPFAKRFTWWPQMFLGLAFNYGAVLMFAAHSGAVRLPSLLLYAAGICWTLYYDTIYAHQDKEDDALIGVKSTARLFAENSRAWLRGFLVATVLLLAAAIIATAMPPQRVLALTVALVGVWGFGWHMTLQMRGLQIDDPASCLRAFRANRDSGLLVALFLAMAAAV